MADFTYIDVLDCKIKSPYSNSAVVYSTAGTQLKTSNSKYSEFFLSKQYAGRHVQIVLRNSSLEEAAYSIGISNKLTLNSAVTIGKLSGYETRTILMPCPLNFDTITNGVSSTVDILGIFIAVAEFDNTLNLNTPELFRVMNLVSRNYISVSKQEDSVPSFLLDEGQYICTLPVVKEESARLSLQITSKRANIFIGQDSFLIQGAVSFCLDMSPYKAEFVVNPYSLTSIIPTLQWDTIRDGQYVLPNIPIWRLENHAS
jgi:hypothetical protein